MPRENSKHQGCLSVLKVHWQVAKPLFYVLYIYIQYGQQQAVDSPSVSLLEFSVSPSLFPHSCLSMTMSPEVSGVVAKYLLLERMNSLSDFTAVWSGFHHIPQTSFPRGSPTPSTLFIMAVWSQIRYCYLLLFVSNSPCCPWGCQENPPWPHHLDQVKLQGKHGMMVNTVSADTEYLT